MKYINGYRLDKYTYICLFEGFFAVVKVNDNGEIVRLRTFGKDPYKF